MFSVAEFAQVYDTHGDEPVQVDWTGSRPVDVCNLDGISIETKRHVLERFFREQPSSFREAGSCPPPVVTAMQDLFVDGRWFVDLAIDHDLLEWIQNFHGSVPLTFALKINRKWPGVAMSYTVWRARSAEFTRDWTADDLPALSKYMESHPEVKFNKRQILTFLKTFPQDFNVEIIQNHIQQDVRKSELLHGCLKSPAALRTVLLIPSFRNPVLTRNFLEHEEHEVNCVRECIVKTHNALQNRLRERLSDNVVNVINQFL